MKTRIAAVFALAMIGPCSEPTEPGWTRVLGLIVDDSQGMSSLVLPAQADRGTPVTIVVSSWGSSSCTRADGYDLTVRPERVEIHIFDRIAPPHTACTEDFGNFPRSITLNFPQPGNIEVKLVGRGFDGQPKVIAKTILIN